MGPYAVKTIRKTVSPDSESVTHADRSLDLGIIAPTLPSIWAQRSPRYGFSRHVSIDLPPQFEAHNIEVYCIYYVLQCMAGRPRVEMRMRSGRMGGPKGHMIVDESVIIDQIACPKCKLPPYLTFSMT